MPRPPSLRTPTRIVAVDWSGAARGAERKIWLAEVAAGSVVRLECGRDRAALAEHLVAMRDDDPALVVGLDFAFSLPAWFLARRGLADAPALWRLAAAEGEAWLGECAPPFWGRPGRRRPGADLLPEPFRATDREVPAVGGIRPKSVFQVGGAGAVGTGSLRGMPLLARLRGAGFAVWPFDAARLPLVVEIYPRALTGAVNKGSAAARRRYLDERHPGLAAPVVARAAGSDDAFDALVSALAMARHAGDFARLAPAETAGHRLEGRIWGPGLRR